MKIAVIKLGTRIVNKGTSGGSGEALSIMKLLSKNFDVHYFTKILKKDPKIDFATGHNILEDNNLDDFEALVVINGNVNFFGGAEDEAQIMNYIMINKFKGPVFYMYCDPELHLKQIWKSIEKKPWGKKYKKEDIYIDKEIIYVHQPYNIEPFRKQIEKEIKVKEYVHFPFYKFPLLNERLSWDWSKKIKDLGYGGTLRGGKREDKILQFLFGYNDLIVEVFGPIKLEKFKKYKEDKHGNPPLFGKSVEYSEFLNKMNEFKATVIIGDKKYNGNNINQRVYESILANNITFIDIELDPQMKIYKNEILRKLLYVKDKNDIEKRMSILKNNEEKCKKICDLQYEDTKINIDEYAKDLYQIISERI